MKNELRSLREEREGWTDAAEDGDETRRVILLSTVSPAVEGSEESAGNVRFGWDWTSGAFPRIIGDSRVGFCVVGPDMPRNCSLPVCTRRVNNEGEKEDGF